EEHGYRGHVRIGPYRPKRRRRRHVADTQRQRLGAGHRSERSARVYAGSELHLYRSSDGGDTWVDLQPGGFLNGTRGIIVAPSNGTVVYRIGANGGSPRLERSDDRAMTWRAATLPGGRSPSTMAVDPRNESSVWAAVF